MAELCKIKNNMFFTDSDLRLRLRLLRDSVFAFLGHVNGLFLVGATMLSVISVAVVISKSAFL